MLCYSSDVAEQKMGRRGAQVLGGRRYRFIGDSADSEDHVNGILGWTEALRGFTRVQMHQQTSNVKRIEFV